MTDNEMNFTIRLTDIKQRVKFLWHFINVVMKWDASEANDIIWGLAVFDYILSWAGWMGGKLHTNSKPFPGFFSFWSGMNIILKLF